MVIDADPTSCLSIGSISRMDQILTVTISPQDPTTQILLHVVTDHSNLLLNSESLIIYTSQSKWGTGRSQFCEFIRKSTIMHNMHRHELSCYCLDSCGYITVRTFPENTITICDIKYHIIK